MRPGFRRSGMNKTPNTRTVLLLALLTAVVLGAGGFGARLIADDDTRKPPVSDGDTGAAAGGGIQLAAPPADGRHFGTINGAYVGPPELAFEQHELFEGDAARTAAEADGQTADSDLYVRKLDRDPVSLPVAASVVVSRANGDEMSYDEFTLSFEHEADSSAWSAAGKMFWITVEDGHVVRIDEQHLP